MKAFLKSLLICALIFLNSIIFAANQILPANSDKNLSFSSSITPEQALELLQQGNAKFLKGKKSKADFLAQAQLTQSTQQPFAVILSCMDSRTAPELLFNQGIGGIFVIRIAGNILNQDELASLEYATKISTAKLIVVMGHTNCGAVKGACTRLQLGHLSKLLAKIEPALEITARTWHGLDCNNPNFINDAGKENVRLVMQQIPEQSPIIKQLLAQHKIMLVGAMQNLATGQVTFYQNDNF